MLRKLIVIMMFFIVGCYTMRADISGYTNPDIPSGILPGSKIFVVEPKEAINPLAAKEVRNKINKILQEKDYELSNEANADYYLLFAYGLGNKIETTSVLSSYQTVGRLGYGTVGMGSSMPITTTQFDRWLIIKVIDGKEYRKSNKLEPVWVGENISRGRTADMRVIIGYLLVTTMEQFGKNTGQNIRSYINRDDDRVKRLD